MPSVVFLSRPPTRTIVLRNHLKLFLLNSVSAPRREHGVRSDDALLPIRSFLAWRACVAQRPRTSDRQLSGGSRHRRGHAISIFTLGDYVKNEIMSGTQAELLRAGKLEHRPGNTDAS